MENIISTLQSRGILDQGNIRFKVPTSRKTLEECKIFWRSLNHALYENKATLYIDYIYLIPYHPLVKDKFNESESSVIENFSASKMIQIDFREIGYGGLYDGSREKNMEYFNLYFDLYTSKDIGELIEIVHKYNVDIDSAPMGYNVAIPIESVVAIKLSIRK